MGLTFFKWVLTLNVIEVSGTIAAIVHDNFHVMVVNFLSSTQIWSYGIKKPYRTNSHCTQGRLV